MIPMFIENNWDQPCYLIWTQCLISTNRLDSAQTVDGNFSIFPQVIMKIIKEWHGNHYPTFLIISGHIIEDGFQFADGTHL